MNRWHTDRQDHAGQPQVLPLHVSAGRLEGALRQQGLAPGVSGQNRLVWLLAFVLAILAHVTITVWVMMRATPQTGTQQPAAVSMLFEAPKVAPSMAAGQAAPSPPAQPSPPMQDMPDMEAQSLTQDMAEVLPPSARPEPEHLPPASAVPKKLASTPSTMQHDKTAHMTAKPLPHAEQTKEDGTIARTHATTGMSSSGGQSAPPASAAAVGQKGGFQLSCSAPESHYPVSARHLHEEGEAVAEVSINGKGQVIAARLVQSTGYDDLDDQALQTVKNLHCTSPEAGVVTGRIPVGFHIQ